jgi:hypothetical protein
MRKVVAKREMAMVYLRCGEVIDEMSRRRPGATTRSSGASSTPRLKAYPTIRAAVVDCFARL